MKATYKEWITDMGMDDPNFALGKCVETCKLMIKIYPELKLAQGVVYSEQNQDNPSSRYPKQYPHAWLVDEEGNVVDPTVAQYALLGELKYKRFDKETIKNAINKCIGCGAYFDGSYGYCGECHYSHEEE